MAARTGKVELTESWRDKISVSMLMNRLQKHADGEIDLDATQVKSIEVILSRIVPTLSAVEQTVPDPLDGVSRSDLIARLRLLIQDPSIARELGIPVAAPSQVSAGATMGATGALPADNTVEIQGTK